jgi:hypothetical protein
MLQSVAGCRDMAENDLFRILIVPSRRYFLSVSRCPCSEESANYSTLAAPLVCLVGGRDSMACAPSTNRQPLDDGPVAYQIEDAVAARCDQDHLEYLAVVTGRYAVINKSQRLDNRQEVRRTTALGNGEDLLPQPAFQPGPDGICSGVYRIYHAVTRSFVHCLHLGLS